MNIASILLHKKYGRVIRFLIAGGTTLLTNLALLYVLKDIFDLWYITASIIGFVGAFGVSFSLQKFWTFGERSFASLHIQVGLSLIVALSNLLLNTFIMYILVDHLNVYYLFAQTIASAIIACESFFVYKYIIFVSRAEKTPSKKS